MPKELPLVSIVMNCHNGQKYLEDSIKSITAQTYQNWELIFWDNASTDNSKQVINKFSDARIKYFKSDNFKKLYESRNLAIKKAKGKLISFLDTDDMWERDKIEKQIEFFEKNKDFKIVYSNYYNLDELKKKKSLKFKKNLPSGMIIKDLLKNYTVGILTVCLNRNIFNEYSFDNNLDIIGDFDLLIKLSVKYKIGYIDKPLASYRLHDSNFSKIKNKLYIYELKNWLQMNKKKFNDNNISLLNIKYLIIKLMIKNNFIIRKLFL